VPAALPFTQTASGDVITLTDCQLERTAVLQLTDNTTLCVANASVTTTDPAAIAFTTAG
jgi:hypothetical protein